MPYCPNCGVELAAEARKCPLCGAMAVADLDKDARAEAAKGSYDRHADPLFDPDNREKLTPAERGTIGWELVSVSTLIAVIGVSAVNLLTVGDMTWALYPLFSLVLVWIVATAALRLARAPLLAVLVAGLAIPLYLFALDLVDGRIDWALTIGIPISLIAEIGACLAWLAGSRAKTRGANVIAYALFAATATCLGIEGAISLSLHGVIRIVWSGIVASALVPVSAFLLYLHHRLRKVSNFRRLFRL